MNRKETLSRDHEQISFMDRLRLRNPDKYIVRAGTELKDPAEMQAFYFGYSEELKTSRLESVREHRFDVAADSIMLMANYVGRPAVKRWSEFFATGNVRDPSVELPWFLANRQKSGQK